MTNNIVCFLRASGLPAPPPAQAAAFAEGLAPIVSAVSRGLPLSLALRLGALGALLDLGGDSVQNVQTSTPLLPRLAQRRATPELAFQALDDLVKATPPFA